MERADRNAGDLRLDRDDHETSFPYHPKPFDSAALRSGQAPLRGGRGAARRKKASMTPNSSGYADVNGIKLYHEIYGQGKPLVLLHGGLMTIGEMSALLEALAKSRNVIAVELQG